MNPATAAVLQGGKPIGASRIGDVGGVWIEVLNPGDDEFEVLQERFKLHRLAVRDAKCQRQAPKLDVYDDQIFVVLKIARLRGDAVVYGQIDAFVSLHHIVTVRRELAGEPLQTREEDRGTLPALRSGPDFILHSIMDRVVGEYFPVVQMIEEEVLSMEQRLLDTFLSRGDVTRLFQLRHEAIRLQHMLTRMSDVCAKLANLDVPCVAAEARPYFRDVHDQLVRLDGMIGGLVDVIGAVFEAGSLLEQQRQGASTRKLAAWAAIFGAPTAIAAIYDMNLPGLPGVTSPHGLVTVLGAMAMLCIALFAWFKRVRWL
jgi:magnesium transporter